jgi:signal peptidase I
MSDPSMPLQTSGEASAVQPQPEVCPQSPEPEGHPSERDLGAVSEPLGTPQPSEKSVRMRRRHEGWLALPQFLLSAIVIVLFVVTFVMQAFQIPSASMEKTLMVGDYIMVDKVHYGKGGLWQHLLPYREIQRGDIIVFRYPVNPSQHFVKRVIALPGDHLHMENKVVWVNGHQLTEHYAVYDSESHSRFPPGLAYEQISGNWTVQLQSVVQGNEVIVPENSYFVLGDNRDDSSDSRSWGFVPRENVVGRPWLIYFSVAATPGGMETAEAADGKLGGLIFTVRHLWEYVRWDRTMRLVQ